MPVAVKITGDPVSPAAVAVSVLLPTTVPKVQLPTVAVPNESEMAVAPVIDPPPLATANGKVNGKVNE